MFAARFGIRPLDDRPDGLFAYNLFRHSGAELHLEDGTVIAPGELLMELHFRREALAPLGKRPDPVSLGLSLIRLADREVPLLAHRLRTDPGLSEIRAMHAISMFHRGIRRYGFEVLPLESRRQAAFLTWWQLKLLLRDHPAAADIGRQIAAAGAREDNPWTVRHVWLSREALLRRYPMRD